MTNSIDINENEFLWSQKYRPQKVEDVILPSIIKDKFLAFVKQGKMPNLLLSSRQPGTGKTTTALAACKEIGCDVLFVNASAEGRIDYIRNNIRSFASTTSFSDAGKVVIFDEADGFSREAMDTIRGIMETFSSNCSFIFTCNNKNQLIEPIHSRCDCIDFIIDDKDKPALAMQLMKRLMVMLDTEKVTYDKGALAGVISKQFPDNRRIINTIQSYANTYHTIDEGIIGKLQSININDLVTLMKTKNYTKLRQWVEDNNSILAEDFFTRFYKSVDEYIDKKSIPEIVVKLGEYQKYHSVVPDKVLNIVACLTEIMFVAEFK